MDRAAEIALLADPPSRNGGANGGRAEFPSVGFITGRQLEALGWKPIDALDRAVLLSYLYVGHAQTTDIAPDVIAKDARRRHVEVIFESLVAADSLATSIGPSRGFADS